MDIVSEVATLLEQNAQALPGDMAQQLGVSEKDVIEAFPTDMATVINGEHAQFLLDEIAAWETSVTVIVHSFGSIFEVKAPLPKGKCARGYFNLMGEPGQLHGHLLLENVAHIAFVSKPFMGQESHYFCFFEANGNTIFKIYLGRDEKRQLLPQQVDAFINIKRKLSQ
jgi:hypothetical protein